MKTKEDTLKIIEKLKSEYPESHCSLDFTNPFELLVGTILSAQSTDARVNMILPELLSKFPTAASMAKADIEDIKKRIKTVGLYNNKAKSLKSMALKLVNDYDSKVPNKMNELTKLPGVGRKTANVVLGNALGVVEGIAVDTHVTRMVIRIGLSAEKSAVKIEKDLMKLVPQRYWVDFTHLFIDHGRKICVKKPKCPKCVIKPYCDYVNSI